MIVHASDRHETSLAVRAKRVAAEAFVAASPDRVWELYGDIAGSADWIPFVEEVISVNGPSGLGRTYRERTRMMGMKDVSDWLIVEWDARRRQVHRSTNKLMDMDLVIEIEPVPGGTRVRQEAVLRSRLPLVGRLHEVAFGLVAGSGLRAAVSAAQDRLGHGDPG
jgi:hypothetical protein